MNCRFLGRMAAASVLTLMTAGAANAADMHGMSLKDTPPVHEAAGLWEGAYMGIHAGFGWGSFNPSDVDPIFGDLIDEELEHDPEGGVLGLQLGYNWQRSRWVLGVEADFARTNIEGDLTYDFDVVDEDDDIDTITDNQDSELRYFATLRARLGVDVGSTLVYATGGLAFGRVHSNFTTTVAGPDGDLPDGTVSGSDHVTHVGWVVGGGVETMIREGFSLKAEYLYADLGEETHTPVSGVPGEPFDLDVHLVRFGLNYHF